MSTPAASQNAGSGGFRAAVQRFGGNLAAMVMPNIGAFIAWGLITALFIPTGWIPNSNLEKLVGPMILTLLPILIGYTGGRLVHDQRGAVAGAVATMGLVVGAEIPMFLGAMLVGPLAAYVIKLFDRTLGDRIKSGFEMLVNNFSLGIIAGGMAILAYLLIGPIVENLTTLLGNGVEVLVDARLLPIASVVIEPAKVLFLNNAINHGVLSPIGSPRHRRRESRSCSCSRRTRDRASAFCSPTGLRDPVPCVLRFLGQQSSTSLGGSTKYISRTCS